MDPFGTLSYFVSADICPHIRTFSLFSFLPKNSKIIVLEHIMVSVWTFGARLASGNIRCVPPLHSCKLYLSHMFWFGSFLEAAAGATDEGGLDVHRSMQTRPPRRQQMVGDSGVWANEMSAWLRTALIRSDSSRWRFFCQPVSLLVASTK